ncbi:type II toxin-antitoxin system CcdA family antitoxin [Novosphingobium sp. AP12]|uniref:type II toxin-antitoxin system CcdA family antitoxin n=1 Tax=Novosphingobium sp. AP12 TaxID=1144305 RepID=UPI000311AB72|nr:type II toxin-antitoxin system CcdA family antitoxin [Novosphingobium sp. AP12]
MPKAATSSVRRATNVSLDASLIEQARDLDINISRACERGLAEQIVETRDKRWRHENAKAIASFNAYVEQNGVPLARFRRF